MNKYFQLLTIAFLSFSLIACASDKAEENKEDINISINDDGIKVNGKEINFNADDNGISFDSDNSTFNLDDNGINFSGDWEEFGKEFEKLAEKLGNATVNGEKVEVVDFRAIKKLLPSQVLGMEQTDYNAEKTGFGSFKTSVADATYQEDNQRVKVSIIDSGGFGYVIGSLAGWSELDIDKESKSGYERTTTIDGHKAFISYDNDMEKGECAIIVNQRFIVAIEGKNISERQFKKLQRIIDLDDVEDLI